jgi:hypothetical protein
MLVKDPTNYSPVYPNGPAASWPLVTPVEHFIRDDTKDPGYLGMIVQTPDADLLRSMRQRALDGAFDPLEFEIAVPVRIAENGPRLQMFMRDVLSPLEDPISGKVQKVVR